ncbi:DUF456 domain-containing protein [Isoptericola sp. 4D.3]|uniref:DUF456 domain-containing protein n=1 Tax=Isoptericola peretonis TaxID=2918523 RepID=A0ABT0IZ11_9MICO|nr:DUF456 domain-containing protein [Isoptericola sp. 4D.3]
MSVLGEVLVGLAIAVGLVGTVVQVLPGNVLVLGSVLVWAWVTGGTAAWVCFAVAAVAIALAELGQWLLAGRHMRRAEVPWGTLAVAGIAGIVGFFVVPVVGLFLFFAGAVFLVELARRRDAAAAWAGTRAALKATLITIGVQLAGGLVATVAWVVGLLVT